MSGHRSFPSFEMESVFQEGMRELAIIDPSKIILASVRMSLSTNFAISRTVISQGMTVLSVAMDAPAGTMVPALQIGVYLGGLIGSSVDHLVLPASGDTSPNQWNYYLR